MTVHSTCPGPAAVVLDGTCASPSMAMTAAPSHENMALPVPHAFKCAQQVAASDVVMIVEGAVLLVVGVSLVAVLQ